MRVLVCGSRDWADQGVIADRLAGFAGDDVEIIHGACSRLVRGVEQSADMLADDIARLYGFDVHPFPADWTRGRRAGPERNRRMLDEQPDLVLAFQRDGSSGTQDTIDEAEKRGIPVEVYTA